MNDDAALNMTLPALAAKHVCSVPAIDQYLLQAPALSSKQATQCCCCRSIGETDGRSDIQPLHRSCPHTMRASSLTQQMAYTVVKVDRRIRWHYTTTRILHLHIGARLTAHFYPCTLALSAGTLMASAGTPYRLVPAHFYPWAYIWMWKQFTFTTTVAR